MDIIFLSMISKANWNSELIALSKNFPEYNEGIWLTNDRINQKENC